MQAVCDGDAIDEGEVEGFEVGGKEILVARVDGELHALGDVCTHERCLLSDGWLEGRDVVCPCHSSKFDLETGEPDRPPATDPEPVYEVVVEDGTVYIDLD